MSRRGHNVKGKDRALVGKSPPDPAFTDPDALEELIEDYFESRMATRTITVYEHGQKKVMTEPYMRPPTMAGLARHLGVVRATLWRAGTIGDEENPFKPVIARALNRLAEWTEEALYSRETATGARFALEVNHGYGKEGEGTTEGAFVQNVIAPAAPEIGTAIPKWSEPDGD